MNGVFLWIAGLLVVVFGALFAVPSFVDWNSYRGVFEEEASRIFGREVRVGGDVNLRLLPAPYVSFGKVRIADSGSGGGDALFRADSFTMWLAVPPLLQGIIEAKQVELTKPMLRLQIGSDGRTNWGDFRVSKGALPFVPRDVALQSVKVSDGVLAVHGSGGEQLARFEVSNGELGAPALEGPFKFRGDVKWDGEVRDVRGATAAPESDGSVRFKLVVRAGRNGNTYTVDGRLIDLATKPHVDGQLVAVFPRPAQPVPVSNAPGEAPGSNVFELRSPIAADALGIKLSDIAFAFEQQGQPQLLTGVAEAGWQGKPFVRANLGSRWLDLDKIASTDATANPLLTAHHLVHGWADYFPAKSDVQARISVDQANLSGDLVTGLVLALEDKGRGLQLQELRAAMPGGGRIDLSGEIKRAAGAEGFQGQLLLRGANLGRFAAWAGRGTSASESRGDGSFWLNSQLAIAPGVVELRNATFDVGGNRLSGEVNYRWQGRKQLSVLLEAGQADLSSVLPGTLGPTLITSVLSGTDLASAPQSIWRAMPVLADADLKLRIRANRLTDGTRELRNVDAEVLAQNGALSVKSLNFVTATGLRLEVGGEVKGLATRPKGVMRGLVAAPDMSALQEAMDMLGSDGFSRFGPRLEGTLPLQLAFTAQFGARSETAVEIAVDGTASGDRLGGTLALDGGLSGWREAPIDAMLGVEGPAAMRLARQLLSEASGTGDVQTSGGRLLFKAIGTPSKELLSLVKLSSDPVNLEIRGRGSFGADSVLRFTGDAEIAAADVANALALIGLQGRAVAGKAGMRGMVRLDRTEHGLQLSAQAVEIGKSRVSGDITLTGSAEARSVDASLKADAVYIPDVLGLLLSNRPKTVASAEPGLPEVADWRERIFDFSNLDRFGGHVAVAADAATFQDGSAIRHAVLNADLEPGRVTVTKLEGRLTGGTLSSTFKLEKAPGGAAFSGVLGLSDVALDELGGGDKPGATGKAQLTMRIAAHGVSPQGLLSTLAGNGDLQLKSARLERLSPDVIDGVADVVLSGRSEGGSDAVTRALKTELGAGPLVLGTRKLPIEISDGVAKLRAIALDMPDTRLTNDTAVELSTLKMDSEWRIQPKQSRSQGRAAPGKGALPGISVLYVGPLASFGSLEPRINSEALERELTVRRMERDVDQLERLRRDDEARAKLEAERMKAVEQGPKQAPQVIEAPFPFPGNPALDAGAPPKVSIEPLPPPLPSPPSAAGTGTQGTPAPSRAAPAHPSWRDQFGRGDRSGT